MGNKVSELYPSGLDLDYTWNDIDRLSTVTDGTNTIASYSYYRAAPQAGRPSRTARRRPTSYTGFRGEVAEIKHETSTPTTLLDLQYGYDENHDRTYERFGGSGSARATPSSMTGRGG